MTVVTGGVVRYERTLKTGDFENKKIALELSFILSDDDNMDAALDKVGDQAVAFVHGKLGINEVATKVKTMHAAAAGKVPATKEAYAETKAQETAPARRRPPASAAKTTAPADDDIMGGVGGATGQAISGGGERVPVVTDDDPLGFLDASPEITDQQIVDRIGVVNGKIKNPVAIKGLISEFAGPPPKTYKDIAQPKRQAFLDKLNAL